MARVFKVCVKKQEKKEERDRKRDLVRAFKDKQRGVGPPSSLLFHLVFHFLSTFSLYAAPSSSAILLLSPPLLFPGLVFTAPSRLLPPFRVHPSPPLLSSVFSARHHNLSPAVQHKLLLYLLLAPLSVSTSLLIPLKPLLPPGRTSHDARGDLLSEPPASHSSP